MNNDQKKRHWLGHPVWTGIGVIVAILTLILTILIWFVPHPDGLFAPPNSVILVSTSSSSIPVLHSSYSGTYFDVTYGTQGPLTLSDVSENTTTGAFTAAGTYGTPQGPCYYQITQGVVSADGKMTYVVSYQPGNGCDPGTADCTAQLNSTGDIKGTWKNVSIQDTGNFTLS